MGAIITRPEQRELLAADRAFHAAYDAKRPTDRYSTVYARLRRAEDACRSAWRRSFAQRYELAADSLARSQGTGCLQRLLGSRTHHCWQHLPNPPCRPPLADHCSLWYVRGSGRVAKVFISQPYPWFSKGEDPNYELQTQALREHGIALRIWGPSTLGWHNPDVYLIEYTKEES